MKVLMFDGTVKDVNELKIKDKLMGVDSTPRIINSINTKNSSLYKITPKKGKSFLVSEHEKLHLSRSKNSCTHKPEVYNINVVEYLSMSISFKNRYCLSKSGVDFKNDIELPIPPYILGLWLGDGTSSKVELTTMDEEIFLEYKTYCDSLGLSVRKRATKSKAYTVVPSMGRVNTRSSPNKFLNKLREMSLINNKHVPQIYLTYNREARLELLAGLIDTDGSLLSNNVLEISQKNERLANEIVFLARSLGFACTIKDSLKKAQTGPKRVYKRIQICGDTAQVPVRLDRKKSKPFKQEKNPLKIGIASIEYEAETSVISFSFEGNCQKYIDENFFVRIA
jgi:replicative DNA helicase